jgi:large subunit ribosomal protein L15
MKQHQLSSPKGAKKIRKRVGRGDGSGHGSFSGKGMKGQNSRSGGGVRPGFEGGQTASIKGLPTMRGFTNRFRKEFSVVNLDSLSRFGAESEVTIQAMLGKGIIRNAKVPVKILGRGEITKPLTVEAHQFSASARKKIEAAGGVVKEIAG